MINYLIFFHIYYFICSLFLVLLICPTILSIFYCCVVFGKSRMINCLYWKLAREFVNTCTGFRQILCSSYPLSFSVCEVRSFHVRYLHLAGIHDEYLI